MSLAALGVVFGDIGTSPLYTLKTVLDITGGHPSAAAALGSLSLIVWTLIIVTSVKYVALAMRVDNDGDGGILALMSVLSALEGMDIATPVFHPFVLPAAVLILLALFAVQRYGTA